MRIDFDRLDYRRDPICIDYHSDPPILQIDEFSLMSLVEEYDWYLDGDHARWME